PIARCWKLTPSVCILLFVVDGARPPGGGDEAEDLPMTTSVSAKPAMLPGLTPAQVLSLGGDRGADDPDVSGAQRLVMGAMSGTSADGVDAALVAVTGRGPAMSCRLLV